MNLCVYYYYHASIPKNRCHLPNITQFDCFTVLLSRAKTDHIRDCLLKQCKVIGNHKSVKWRKGLFWYSPRSQVHSCRLRWNNIADIPITSQVNFIPAVYNFFVYRRLWVLRKQNVITNLRGSSCYSANLVLPSLFKYRRVLQILFARSEFERL